MYDEDDLTEITNKTIKGYISYWNPDNPNSRRNLTFSQLNTTEGYSLGATDSYTGSTLHTYGIFELDFTVKETSVITYIEGKGNPSCWVTSISISGSYWSNSTSSPYGGYTSSKVDNTYVIEFRDGSLYKLTEEEFTSLLEQLYRGVSFEDAMVVIKI